MADLEALRDAEALLQQASDLVSCIDREVALMEAALADARSDLQRIERLASEAAEHVSWLGSALSEGRRLQRRIEEGLATVTRAAWELDDIALTTTLLRAPSLVGVEQGTERRPVRREAELPSLRTLDAESLRETELRPLQAAPETWDALASDLTTLEESFRTALELLDEAESMAAEEPRRERRRHRDKARPRTDSNRSRR